jgi:hypothetical protein
MNDLYSFDLIPLTKIAVYEVTEQVRGHFRRQSDLWFLWKYIPMWLWDEMNVRSLVVKRFRPMKLTVATWQFGFIDATVRFSFNDLKICQQFGFS